MDGRLNAFLFDHSPHPEQAPPPEALWCLDQRRELDGRETWRDDLGAGKAARGGRTALTVLAGGAFRSREVHDPASEQPVEPRFCSSREA